MAETIGESAVVSSGSVGIFQTPLGGRSEKERRFIKRKYPSIFREDFNPDDEFDNMKLALARLKESVDDIYTYLEEHSSTDFTSEDIKLQLEEMTSYTKIVESYTSSEKEKK